MPARSIKVFKILMISVFCLSDVCILNVQGAGSLVTTPTAIDGVLTSCGETRLTCSHDNVPGENTRWTITRMDSSIVCEVTINHLRPTPETPYSCNDFRFEDITALMMGANNDISDLNSTAMVNPLPFDLSGSRMECIAGSLSSSPVVGNVTLCVIDQLPPPTNLACENITNGLNVSWEAVNVTSCTMSDIVYNVTATGIDMIPVTVQVSTLETTTELTNLDGLEADTTYNISVSARTAVGSCGGEEATIVCATNASLPIVTTQPSTVPTTDSSLSLTSSGPSSAVLSTGAIVGIAVAIVVVIIIIVLVIVTMIVIIFTKLDGERGNNRGLHAPLADDNEKQQLPVYAMVDKSKKVPNEQPMYQDPNTIQHETTASGDVYAVSDRRGKSVKNEGDAVYTEVDKSKKNHGLTYASIDMPAGGGSSELSKRPAPTEYSTVIN